MDPSERQGSQQKKSRKPLPTSRKSTGAPATASARADVPPSGLGAASGTFAGGSGAAAPSLGCGTGSHHVPSAFWGGMSPGGSFTPDSNPSSSEWHEQEVKLVLFVRLYPPGGFVNSLQMPYPYVNYLNASQLQENSHSVGCPSTRGTPSPNGSSLAKDGSEAQETIDIDGDETPEPARTDKQLNWSHEEDVRLAEKMTEAQQSLANKKLEVAKLNHKAAQEQTKAKMLDLYKDLLCGSTSDLSEEAMAERTKALECMRLALFANPN
ncbi:uncharacterized protein C2845_PM05G34700 [Panicum miliaceum]|uniref:No apical meristem-associated C-terminal domain-containing protein n=1 Tax=Panicum miliaceum TaxID=4540 RepID=A0A3L6T168_PANMI|nr:uncharacterized protein C2845_PM05G34700 [Panicum miliaceum]